MITRTLPRKLSELGRIRIGDRESNPSGKGTHPHKLAEFRLTSPNGPLLHHAAALYGGEVRPWAGEGAPIDDYGRPSQFELYTTVNSIDVLIPTMSALTLWYEQWTLAGCQRRCDGVTIQSCPMKEALEGTPCTCPPDDVVRADQAKTGKACARILRLNVLLPDLPGMGTWRLETKGFYATAELLGTLDLLRESGAEHHIIEAALRLEQRTVKRPGRGDGKGTLKFVVPVLWPKYTPRQLLAGAANVLLAPPAPVPRLAPAHEDVEAQHAAHQQLLDEIRGLYSTVIKPLKHAGLAGAIADQCFKQPWSGLGATTFGDLDRGLPLLRVLCTRLQEHGLPDVAADMWIRGIVQELAAKATSDLFGGPQDDKEDDPGQSSLFAETDTDRAAHLAADAALAPEED